MGRVETLVTPHEGDEVFGFRQVDDVMRIAGNHFHNLDFIATDLNIDHLISTNLTKPDQTVAADYHELLVLGVVPVLTFGNPRFGDIDRELPAICCTNQFGKATPVIDIHLQGIGKLLLGQVTEVSAIKFLTESIR